MFFLLFRIFKGSGKTLAFGLPILQAILNNRAREEPQSEEKQGKRARRPLSALIITPTRELAVQIKDHISAAAQFTDITVRG